MNGLCPYTSDDLSISVHNVAMGPVEILLVLVGPRCLRPRGVHGVAAGDPSSPLGPGPITGQDSRRGVIAPPGIMRKDYTLTPADVSPPHSWVFDRGRAPFGAHQPVFSTPRRGSLRSAMSASVELACTGPERPHLRQWAIFFLPPSTLSTSTG